MSEHQLYRDHVISWVFYLFTKYCKDARFHAAMEAFKSALTKEELEAARIMWSEENR